MKLVDSSRFQPGKGPSRGLLHDYKNSNFAQVRFKLQMPVTVLVLVRLGLLVRCCVMYVHGNDNDRAEWLMI